MSAHKIKIQESESRIQDLNFQSGQFLLEVVIAVGVMLMLAHAFFTLIGTSYQLLVQSRSQASAKAIANEKMEIIRNMSFDQVGTVGGIPSGPLLQEETVLRNGQAFNVSTAIVYKDDAFDQLAPDDTNPADYKMARVGVTWTPAGFPTNQEIVILSNISPHGMETTVGGGTLNILVFDSLGAPVPQADVVVDAPSVGVNLINLSTNDFGMITLPGSPACTTCYSITVTKSGYSTDRTYMASEVANPTKPPLTVIDGQVSQASFAIDELADVVFESKGSREEGFPPLGNVAFHLRSDKTVGTDTSGDPVYKLDEDYTTDGGGSANLQLESANYIVTLNNGYDLGGSYPFSPLNIPAGGSMTVLMSAVTQSVDSLLIQVQDVGGSAIASAAAELTNIGLGYDGTLDTGNTDNPDFGQAWFGSLSADTDYQLVVTHPDYDTSTTTGLDVSGPSIQKVIMNPK